jgi:cytochrome c-type biogenesis protein
VIILFGIFMLHIPGIKLFSLFNTDKRFHSRLQPGRPLSSLLFGATFAFGWSPCVGPILGTVLILSSSTATIVQGAFLLGVFSLGLGIPFLLIALGISHALTYVKKLTKFLPIISTIGGVFLIFIGALLLTDSLIIWNAFFYRLFGWVHYDLLFNLL